MEENRKHLVWINTNPPDILDIGTWLFTTQELRNAGWDVTLILADKPGKHEKLGVEYIGIPMPDIYLLSQMIYHSRVTAYLSHLDQPADVIMFHEMSAPAFFLHRLLRNMQGKKRPLYVLDIRSLPMQPDEISHWKDRLRSWFFDAVNWVSNRGTVDGRVVITKHMGRVLNIPEEKLWGIWTSGVQPDLFSTASKIRDWQVCKNQVNVIYIGSLSIGRNLDVFGKAVIAANKQGMKFTMTYVGEGNVVPVLLDLVKEGEGSIRVIPSVPHNQIQDWLAQAHIGVLPFPDEEMFRVSSPIKLFEYAASGLAILATRIECHTSVMGNEKFAIWAENSTVQSFVESLKLAWQERESLSKMGELAEKAAQKWTWARSAANLSEALHHGINKNG